MTDLMKMLLAAGYKKEDFAHHDSDLYFYKTPETTKVLHEWVKKNGWKEEILSDPFLCNVFKDQITGRLMYDCAFQYAE